MGGLILVGANGVCKFGLSAFSLLWEVLSTCQFSNIFSLCSMIWSIFYMLFGRKLIINLLNKLSLGFGLGDSLAAIDSWLLTSLAEFITQTTLEALSFNSGNFLTKLIWIMLMKLIYGDSTSTEKDASTS
jgi:hypothetical protein